jgi:sugar phosphate isomerase/epimerase
MRLEGHRAPRPPDRTPSEVGPGEGELDYAVYLRELDKLDPDVPLILEHMRTADEYRAGAAYVRGVAQQVGVRL